jgi:hypothetical protein
MILLKMSSELIDSHYIRFTLESCDCLKKWKQIRKSLFGFIGSNRDVNVEDFLFEWTDNCKITTNQEAYVFHRYNQGFGLNVANKYVYTIIPDIDSWQYTDGIKYEIRMKIGGETELDIWSDEEIQDLIDGFVKTCDKYISSVQSCKGVVY